MGTGAAVAEGDEITNTKMNLKLEIIIDADVDAGAAIAWTKTAGLASAHILVGSAGAVAVDVAMSGDILIDNAGATSFNGAVIVTGDIAADAAIAWTQMAALAAANILVGSAGGVATAVAITGDITIDNAGLVAIAGLAIIDADVNAAAAIAWSKMAALADGHILVGSAGTVPTDVAMSGDATLINTGAVTIAANAVTIAKVEDALLADTLGPFVMSFETDDYPCVTKLYFNHKVTINKIRSIVFNAIEATNNATIVAANSVGDMANGTVTIDAAAAIDVEDEANPTTNNVIAADSYIQLTTAKANAGGKVLVTIEYTRTA